jgi:hypothetical protein
MPSHRGVLYCGCSAIFHGLPQNGVSFKHHEHLLWTSKYTYTPSDRFFESYMQGRGGSNRLQDRSRTVHIMPRQTIGIVRLTAWSWRVWFLVVGPTGILA